MFEGKFRQVIKIIRPHYVFVLFGFVEVNKFRDSVKFRIEFIMVEKSNQKKNWYSVKRPRYDFRDTALRNAGSWSRKRRQQETTHETKVH